MELNTIYSYDGQPTHRHIIKQN